jgi:hypothetical protein
MKNTINKIFSGEKDDGVHADFIKYSRGVFDNRYLLEGKKQKIKNSIGIFKPQTGNAKPSSSDKWAIKSSAEFANFFVRRCLEKARGNVKVSGAIICTFSLQGKIEFERVKQFAGVKQHLINSEMPAEKILKLMDECPRAFYALSFSTPDCELKIKAKAPKSGKPGTKTKDDEGGPKADFCSLKTSDIELVKDLFFDFPSFTEIKIRHTLEIKEIELPKDAKTPEEMRAKARRKGIVKRFVEVDGKKEVKEAKLDA